MPRSLEQWLAHQSQAHPQTIDLGLERSKQVLERLRWRQPAVPVITVGGTNGKGSVTAYCAAILRAAGYRVGTFTSPHLRDYRERIRVHDRWVTSGELVAAFEQIESACQGTVSLTFFEYNALAAFLIFETAKLDVWVLEVGLGGRLDAVNIVDPTVAVVVSIGLDHQEFLGTTLEAIAQEKAGIFRSGCTAVLGSRRLPAVLLQSAEAVGAIPKRLGAEFDYRCRPPDPAEGTGTTGGPPAPARPAWDYRGRRWNLTELPPPALAGETQYANAATAIAAVEELPLRLTIPAAAVAQGITEVRLAGRFQIIDPVRGPRWILDVAHNPDAAGVLRANLVALPAGGRTLAVCGILADKDAPAIAAEVRGCFDAWWLASTEGARGISAASLAARIAAEVSVPVRIAEDVAAACAAAAADARPADRIVVFGSFHTVGPALEWLESQHILARSTDSQ